MQQPINPVTFDRLPLVNAVSVHSGTAIRIHIFTPRPDGSGFDEEVLDLNPSGTAAGSGYYRPRLVATAPTTAALDLLLALLTTASGQQFKPVDTSSTPGLLLLHREDHAREWAAMQSRLAAAAPDAAAAAAA